MPATSIKEIGRKLFGRNKPKAEVREEAVEKQSPATDASNSERRRPPRRRNRGRRAVAENRAPQTEEPKTPWALEQFKVEPKEGLTRFHDLDLPLEIMHAVSDLGFEYCTPVQAESLLPTLGGKNVAAQAQTGTGKTAAFLIAAFTRLMRLGSKLRLGPGKPRVLVIAPTRELVIQIAKDAEHIGKYCGYRCVAIYGGMDFSRQEKELHEPVDIISATPGRLLDFKNRGLIDLGNVDTLVIDEADRMLDMGFIPDVRRIIRATMNQERRQTMLFSATLSDDVMRLARQWMPDPVKVEIEPDNIAVDNVEQLVYSVASRDKYALLYNLLASNDLKRVLIFGNRRIQTQALTDRLKRHGIDCEVISGAVAQNKRVRILEQFREGELRVLVATDVAARGLHIAGVSHVINYDFPYEPESYVHRIGRTGRAGAFGTAISFACEDESFIIPEIEAYIGHVLRCEVPSADMVKAPPRYLHPPAAASREDRPRGRAGRPSDRSRSSGRSRRRR